jgi:hypothetical protein
MFARIRFTHGHKVTKDRLDELEEFLSDKVDKYDCYKDEDGKEIDFYDWKHTIDPKKVDEEKSLVYLSEDIKLSTSKEYIVELSSFMSAFPELEINLRGTMKANNSGFDNAINLMLQAEAKLTTALKSFNEKIEFNNRCDVHIGNLGLLNINQLAYTTDKCTEELQNILNEGWRILAVCPQPDQRRPDYVLGRYNENHKSDMYCDHL